MSDATSADETKQMTVEEAAFEFAAAFADLEKIVEHNRGRDPKELLHQVKSAYDLDEADHAIDRERLSRVEGFEPFSVRVKDEEYPDWKCSCCGNRPRLKFEQEPPFECDYCGALEWTDDSQSRGVTA